VSGFLILCQTKLVKTKDSRTTDSGKGLTCFISDFYSSFSKLTIVRL